MKPLLLPLLALIAPFASAQTAPFALHGGDRVVFYGDSITDQRLYTLYTEAYVRTRYPGLKVAFTHSGWGGDRVTGGGGGPHRRAARSRCLALSSHRRHDHARHERRGLPSLRPRPVRHLPKGV